jgi:hypothetical protein
MRIASIRTTLTILGPDSCGFARTLNKIAAKTASGLAASVLAPGEFRRKPYRPYFIKRRFGTSDVQWNGFFRNPGITLIPF